MVRLKNLKKKLKYHGEIIAKLEFFNPFVKSDFCL